ncbi:MAG: TonB-dependent receptor [Sphingomonadales bacterium]
MKPHHFNRLMYGTAIVGVLALPGMGTALAQDAAPTQRVAAFEEIIVTAEKRETSLQEVPQSITAVSGATLRQLNIDSADQLTNLAPGLVVTEQEGFENSVTIRGLGRNDTQSGGTSQSVALHQDGVFLQSTVSLNTDLLDVAQIEVLRGPQGTVFGQNAIGGVINIITNQPKLGVNEGEVEVGFGNEGFFEARGIGNFALGETLAIRFAVQHIQHDGFSRNLELNQDLDEADNISGRVQLLWQPTDNFSATIRHEHFDADTSGQALKSVFDPTPGARNLRQDDPGFFLLNQDFTSIELQYDTDWFTAKFLGSRQGIINLNSQDLDRGTRDFNNFIDATDTTGAQTGVVTTARIVNNNTEREIWTAELNIVSKGDNFFDWIVGAFYLDETTDVDFLALADRSRDGVLTRPEDLDRQNPFSNPDLDFQTTATNTNETFAIFGQATVNITDSIRFIGGLRYTEADVASAFTNFFILPGVNAESSNFLTGRAAIQVDLSEDVNAYFNYTRGGKPGSGNLTSGSVVMGTVEEEKVNSFELGVKSRLMDQKVQFNAAAFFYDFQDYQILVQDPVPFAGGVVSIPKAEIMGAEIEASAFITDRFRIDMHGSYLDTEIKSDFLALDGARAAQASASVFAQGFGNFSPENIAARAAEIQNLRGAPLPNSPEWAFNITASHVFDVIEAGDLIVSVNWRWQDSFSARAFENPLFDSVSSYSLLGASAQLNHGNWRFEVSASNILDKDAVNNKFTDRFAINTTGIAFVAPRVVRASAAYRF